jgi:hypothetical protein
MLNHFEKSIQLHTNKHILIQVNTKISAKTHKNHKNTSVFRID